MPKTELQRLADTNALDNHLNPDLGKYSHLLDEPTRQNKEIGQVEANKVFLEKKFGDDIKFIVHKWAIIPEEDEQVDV